MTTPLYLPGRVKNAGDIREFDVIVHPDGQPATVTYYGITSDDYGYVHSFGFGDHRAPYACRDKEQVQTLVAVPTPGTDATFGIGSDCYPKRVVKVSPSGKSITVMSLDRDGNTIPGTDEVATWSPKYARWAPKGSHRYCGLYFGIARDYRDPSF